MCQDERALLRQQLVLFHTELLQELAPRDGEDGLEQAAPKDVRGLVARQAVVALRHVAVAQPARVVHLVGRAVVLLRALPVLRGRLQLPVVEAQQEHLGQLEHGLALLGRQVAEFILHEVQHALWGGTEGKQWRVYLRVVARHIFFLSK